MRVFIAFEFDNYIKDYIAKIQDKVKKYSMKGNFTYLENFHLTIRFIGEVEDHELVKLKYAIDETALKSNPFSVKLGSLGYFSRKTKKIIWIGINEGQQYIRALFSNLETHLQRNGFEREERGIKPHITIGREVRLNTDFDTICKNINIDNKRIILSKISLMESKRVEGKLRYIPIYVRDLKQ